ncbi:hypothetical protein JMJ77_0002737 [Colletotrichum scovillei]|uniref:Uncharacterized protein n=1 Tax=Colletotrichum scovillei TaxID=1209932 RepID=A0A9P7UDN1_9PEZI|nr:hypothetical protein JMJ77_0002737 [Colletotrichum scovillei]KAG7071161.1 hypothetical protein JMJ76_0002398 [Colletotrichum scovillei]KAG7079424.1 hypothetical protein JMJ78_0003077 [Colletotrichum scovillei]
MERTGGPATFRSGFSSQENRRRSRHHHRHSGSTHTMALARCSSVPANHLIK